MKMPPDPEWYAEKAKQEDGCDVSAGLPPYIPGFAPSDADIYYNIQIVRLLRTIEASGREIIEQQEELSKAYSKIARLKDAIKDIASQAAGHKRSVAFNNGVNIALENIELLAKSAIGECGDD